MNGRHLIASALVLAASAAAAAESPMHESIVRERPMNFDEAKVKPFALPDVMTFADGTKVTRETWARRRQEMLAILSREMLGAEPPKPDVLELEASTNVVVCAGFGLRRNYRMWFRKDRSGPYVDWTVWLPNRPLVQNAESGPSYVNPLKGVPVVLMLNYSGNHILNIWSQQWFSTTYTYSFHTKFCRLVNNFNHLFKRYLLFDFCLRPTFCVITILFSCR